MDTTEMKQRRGGVPSPKPQVGDRIRAEWRTDEGGGGPEPITGEVVEITADPQTYATVLVVEPDEDAFSADGFENEVHVPPAWVTEITEFVDAVDETAEGDADAR